MIIFMLCKDPLENEMVNLKGLSLKLKQMATTVKFTDIELIFGVVAAESH